MVAQKACSACGRTLPTEAFNRERRRKDGLAPQCKECRRAYRERTAEQRAETLRVWRLAHREEQLVKGRAYREAHRDELRAKARRYHLSHKTERQDYARRYWTQNAERMKATNHAWRERQDPERRREYMRRWREQNPEAWRAHVHRRLDRLIAGGAQYTRDEWQALLAHYGHRCLSCGSTTQIVADHVIPLSLGGSNSILNIQPLCRHCNASKKDRIVDYR